MRFWFALLVLALVVVTAWAVWQDAFPEWRRYQTEFVRREIARLEAELETAREEARRPEVRAALARIDGRLRTLDADAAAADAPLARARTRLREVEAEIEKIRHDVRDAEQRLREPRTAERQRRLGEELDRVERAYAAATGTWPPDEAALERLWAERDSLAEELVALEGPVQLLRARLEEKRGEARELRLEAVQLGAVRDSLEAERSRLLAPVTTREFALGRLRERRLRIREIASPDGREVARCPTCHGAIDDSPGAHPALPAMEVFRDVPCTACHRGSGRALDVDGAHRGLLTAAGFGAGPYSLRARIEQLRSRDPAERDLAREELQRITGLDPVAELGMNDHADPDSAIAASWETWWQSAEAYFEPTFGGGAEDESALLAIGIDPWIFSVRGRPLRYVGSRKCLACHEVQHREHSRRWLATKSRSIERLVDEADPEPCFECHTTGWDPARGTYFEPGVTCEGCHGPGERYNEMMFVGQELLGRGEEARGRALLDHASRLARDAVSLRTVPGDAGPINVCVKCHHPRRHRDRGPGILEREPRGPAATDEEEERISAKIGG